MRFITNAALVHLVVAAAAMIVIPPQEGSGPYGVAQTVIPLTDEGRMDPYAPNDKRRILLTAYTPVSAPSDAGCDTEIIPYMPPQTADVYGLLAAAYGLPNTTFGQFELEFCKLDNTATSSCETRYPVLIFSPGLTGSRLLYAAHLRAVASRGFVVLSIDHPYDAFIVEFPDGTSVAGGKIENTPEQLQMALDTRAQDVYFLINQLEGSLPSQIPALIDTSKLIVYGHSFGGATSAQAILGDARIAGGLDMDGNIYGNVTEHGIDKPFILVGHDLSGGERERWQELYASVRADKQMVYVDGAEHPAFTDMKYLTVFMDIPPEALPNIEKLLGKIDGKRIAGICLDYVIGFAALVREGDAAPLRGIGSKYSEIRVQLQDLA